MTSEPRADRLADAAPSSLAARFAPPAALPYVQLARLDRPIGWWLLLLPCWQSSALASIAMHTAPHWGHLVLFLVGAVAMRGAGSTYNDLVDRDVDRLVERTRNRPLPAGRISTRTAKIFLIAQTIVGALVLFSLNWFSIGLGVASLALVAVYPFMKRVTSWPQAVLGLAFAWGGLMGWAAETGSLSLAAIAIYASAFFWTIGYDTIYALQDVRDDSIAGIRSTARLFAGRVREAVGGLYGAAIAAAAAAAALAHAGLFGWLGVAGFAAHLMWQYRRIVPADPGRALLLFRSNRTAGQILALGLLAEAIRGAYFG